MFAMPFFAAWFKQNCAKCSVTLDLDTALTTRNGTLCEPCWREAGLRLPTVAPRFITYA